jgi:VWFA-related protein
MKKLLLTLIAFSLFLTLLANPKPIQQKKSETQLQYEVIVTLKLVQVYVTDKNGNPVTDLTKDEFILYDNGKLQPITDFEKHLLIQPEKKIEEKIAKTELPPAEDVSPRMNRKFFLLLDSFQNDIVGIVRSKKAALHFIETQLQPTDEVGVLSYSRDRGLILNEYLTNDHQKVREAIKRIKGFQRKTKVSGAERDWMKMRIRQFASEIKDLAKALRYMPGFKNIIFFSAGISRDLLYDEGALEEKTDPGVRVAVEDMSKELAASNIPVYSVNTEGARALLEKGTSSRGDHALKMISDLSGGRYFPDVNYYEKIAKIIQNVTGNYYVLGYYIDEKWDGKYHEIKVKVKRKGCEVYAQGGYFNAKPFSEFSEFEKQLQLMDLAFSEKPYFQEALRFPLLALPCSRTKESNLVMLSEIAMDKIKEVIKGESEVLTLIFDEENNIADSHTGEVNFCTLSQEKIYVYSISSLLPGNYECRLVFRDIKTGKGAVASSSVVIPEASDSGIKLFPPLLLIPEEKALYLKLSHDQEKGIEKGSLSLNDVYPFLPDNFSPLVDEANLGIKKLLAVLRLSIIDVQESEIEISAHLIDRSSDKKIPLSKSSIHAAEKREGIDMLLIEFQLPELEVGEYSVVIIAEEMTTQEKSQTTRTFKIRER